MDNISSVLSVVQAHLPKLEFSQDEQMKEHTSFKIGGPVRVMFFPKSADEILELNKLLLEYEIPSIIMGNGTNLLASDEPMNLAVINMMKLCGMRQIGETEISADAGVMLSKLAVFANELELSGLEFAHGIPGSLGGAVTMNAGAYGGEMKDVVIATTALCPEKGIVEVTGAEHDFSYRHSRFSSGKEIVISTKLKLLRGDKKVIRAKMDELCEKRRTSQPLDMPSAGSTFKRPKDGYAGTMIEQAGLKGYTVGGAQVSEKHAGFVVNRGGATFSDVMRVIEHVREVVFKQFGVYLEMEVKVIE